MSMNREQAERQASYDRLTSLLFGRDESNEAPSELPVIGLRIMPKGPSFLLGHFQFGRRPKRLITVGRSEECDIRLEDKERSVSSEHCMLEVSRCRTRVYLHDGSSRNGSYVNGVRTRMSEIRAGDVLKVGAVELLAIPDLVATDRVLITAATFPEFVINSLRHYQTIRKTAAGIEIPYSSLQRWLKLRKIELADVLAGKDVLSTLTGT